MLIAEIRRKLLDVDDLGEDDGGVTDQVRQLLASTKEDLLTADVFGALKYLPRHPYLTNVLGTIAARNGQSKTFARWLEGLAIEADHLKFSFWPTYPNPAGLDGYRTEPDVEIANSRSLLFFEAKLYSGFGLGQIERQLLIGLEQARGREFFLVLVTPGTRPPRIRSPIGRLRVHDYLRRLSELKTIPRGLADQAAANAERVVWISWQTITGTLQKTRRISHTDNNAGEFDRCIGDIVDDLSALMAMRQLQPFHGLAQNVTVTELGRPILGCCIRVQSRVFSGFSRLCSGRAMHALPIELCRQDIRCSPDVNLTAPTINRVAESLPSNWIRTSTAIASASISESCLVSAIIPHKPMPIPTWLSQIRRTGTGSQMALPAIVRSVDFDHFELNITRNLHHER